MASFGGIVAKYRKQAGLSQKDLACRIKKADGTPISAQYLNDLERDRRNPPDQDMLRQIADELTLPLEYLLFLAGELPGDLQETSYEPKQVQAAFRAFRRVLKEDQP